MTSPTLLFVGDYYQSKVNSTFNPSNDLVDLIKNGDLSVVNLEASFAKKQASVKKSGPSLLGSPQTAVDLFQSGFNCASLANNHITDFGYSSARASQKKLNHHSIVNIGLGSSASSALEPRIIKINKVSLAIFSCAEKEFGTATEIQPGYAWISHPNLVRNIAYAKKQNNLVIVLAHGGNENSPIPSTQRQSQLRALVDAGANLVIGHHPHVIQGIERYKKSIICYSLGNFFFNSSLINQDTDLGLVVQVGLDKTFRLKLKPYFVVRKNNQLSLVVQSKLVKSLNEYLSTLNNIIKNNQLGKYWSAYSYKTFYSYYLPQIKDIHNSFFKEFIIRIKRLLKIETEKSLSVSDKLDLLNLFQNESHRWLIQTALESNTTKNDLSILNKLQTKYQSLLNQL